MFIYIYIYTWSPSEGSSPEPTRRSKTLRPPEFGSSKKSAEEEGGGGSEKMNAAEKVVEMSDRDNKGLLVIIVGDDAVERVANMLLV